MTGGRGRSALVTLVVAAAAGALCAGDYDPYLDHPSVPILPLPSRLPLRVAQGVALTLAAALAIAPPAGPWTRRGAAALGVVSLALLLLSTPFVRPQIHFVSVVLATVVLASLAAVLVATRASAGTDRPAVENAVTAVFASAFVFLLVEGVATLHPATHAVGYTLAARHWYEKYWILKNPRGFRDADRDREPGRRIYVLGDSFVAGVGIADVEDRFSNLLHGRLAPEFRVYNLGWNGANTRGEYATLLRQPTPPDLLILSYYANDIQEACEDAGPRIPPFTPYANLGPMATRIVRRSYALDTLYWQIPQTDLLAFEDALEACDTDPKVLETHLRDLDAFVAYGSSRKVPLLVVVFPHLVETERTRREIGPVIDFFRSRGVTVLDVSELLVGLPVARRIVNRNDAHPSRELHRRVAESLLDLLRSRGLLDAARAR